MEVGSGEMADKLTVVPKATHKMGTVILFHGLSTTKYYTKWILKIQVTLISDTSGALLLYSA